MGRKIRYVDARVRLIGVVKIEDLTHGHTDGTPLKLNHQNGPGISRPAFSEKGPSVNHGEDGPPDIDQPENLRGRARNPSGRTRVQDFQNCGDRGAEPVGSHPPFQKPCPAHSATSPKNRR